MRKARWIVVIGLVVVAAAAGWFKFKSRHSNALRELVFSQCMPNQRERNNPAPCAEVNLHTGYALLKVRNGPLQFLLTPTSKINGIESPILLEPQTPDYFWLAWQSRHWLSMQRGAPVPDRAIAMAVNSRMGRTQNQLHVHVSCLRRDLRRQLDHFYPSDDGRWHILPGGINGYLWMARRLSTEVLRRRSPFILLAEGVPGAREHMGRFGLAIVPQSDGKFLLLAIERNLLRLNFGNAEQILDHDCALLNTSHY